MISGETDGSFIDGSRITGNLQIDSSDADGDAFSIGMAALPNKIGRNLSFTNNTGPSPVPPNRVDAATENARDREFWDEVDRRMAELERAHLDRRPAGRGEPDAGSPA